MLYKQALAAENEHIALEYKNEADNVAQSLILEIGKEEQIAYHILLRR